MSPLKLELTSSWLRVGCSEALKKYEKGIRMLGRPKLGAEISCGGLLNYELDDDGLKAWRLE